MDEALGAFELLQGFHNMSAKWTELGKVQAGHHRGGNTKESHYFFKGGNAIHFNE